MTQPPVGAASRVQHPGVPFPPPVLFVAGFVAGLALERWMRVPLPGSHVRGPFLVAGWFSVVMGVSMTLWGLVAFVKARTAIIPIRPASRLVGSGPYRFSRNPMYVGLGMLYVGLALVLDVAWPLALLPLVLVALYLLVIRREERYLASAFGDEYAAYRRRVRRWL